MFGLKIFVRVQTFWRGPPVPPHNFCHPGGATYRRHLSCRKSEKMSSRPDWGAASLLNLFKRYFQQEYFLKEWILHTLDSPNCWYFSFSSFTTLTSLLKLWQPLQIRFDISMDENEKLYFDFFCRGKMGRHVQADDAAGHDIERLSILRHIVCTNRRYYAKENTLKIKFRNL